MVEIGCGFDSPHGRDAGPVSSPAPDRRIFLWPAFVTPQRGCGPVRGPCCAGVTPGTPSALSLLDRALRRLSILDRVLSGVYRLVYGRRAVRLFLLRRPQLCPPLRLRSFSAGLASPHLLGRRTKFIPVIILSSSPHCRMAPLSSEDGAFCDVDPFHVGATLGLRWSWMRGSS